MRMLMMQEHEQKEVFADILMEGILILPTSGTELGILKTNLEGKVLYKGTDYLHLVRNGSYDPGIVYNYNYCRIYGTVHTHPFSGDVSDGDYGYAETLMSGVHYSIGGPGISCGVVFLYNGWFKHCSNAFSWEDILHMSWMQLLQGPHPY